MKSVLFYLETVAAVGRTKVVSFFLAHPVYAHTHHAHSMLTAVLQVNLTEPLTGEGSAIAASVSAV